MRYTRAQFADKLTEMDHPVSVSTVYRWEKQGRIPKPKKLAHSGELLYTDENVKAALAFMQLTIEPMPVRRAGSTSKSTAA
jgi:DNA-binding transcriptional MerR regulator